MDRNGNSQIILNRFAGEAPITLDLNRSSANILELKYSLQSILGLDIEYQRITTEAGRCVNDLDFIFQSNCNDMNNVHPPIFNLLLRLPGGKGGFGAALRAQGGKMNSKKTTNFEACRDLSGRRLGVVNGAKKLADFIEQEPERKKAKKQKLEEKINKGMKEFIPPIHRFDDQEFLKAHEEGLIDAEEAVQKGVAKGKGKVGNNVTLSSKNLSFWDEEESEEEDEEESENGEEEEQNSEQDEPEALKKDNDQNKSTNTEENSLKTKENVASSSTPKRRHNA